MYAGTIFSSVEWITARVINVYVDCYGQHLPVRYDEVREANVRLEEFRHHADRGAYRINVKPR